MSTEHVEELLSAYLDNALTQEEQANVALHLQTCVACNSVLADFRRFDMLLAKQPHVNPDAALRERIFSSKEYLDLIEDLSGQTINDAAVVSDIKNRQTVPQKRISPNYTNRPRLIALPTKVQKIPLSDQETKARIRTPQRRNMSIQRFMQVMIAACLLFTLGVGSFIGWHLLQEQGTTTHNSSGITPPQSPHQGGPLSAGMRLVFLRDGSLWSTPEDGSTQAARLTSTAVTVAPHWTVNPAPSDHTAGNLLAYVDMKQGYVHIIRSDGQSDTVVKQPLLENASTASWNTSIGESVLESLSWSTDGHTLAFITATADTTKLYTYSISTNQIQPIALPYTGSVSHLVWSPDSARIAFEFTYNSTTSILDYNVLAREILTVAPTIASIQNPRDTVLTLDWTLNDVPTITWSVGTQGHIHSVWLRRVGIQSTNDTQVLSNGDYTQAVYSRYGEYGTGVWLLCRALTTNTDRLLLLSSTGAVSTVANGSQIGVAQWTVDGKHITYFDSFASGVGTLHSVDTATGINTVVANVVRNTPAPVWSIDGQHLLYSKGTHSFVADTQNNKIQLSVIGSASAFTWSTTSLYTAIVTIQGAAHGIYLVDTQRNTAKSLSMQSIAGPIAWTQVP